DARDARTRDGDDRRSDRARAPGARRRSGARHGARGSRDAVPEVPAVSGIGSALAAAVAAAFAPDGALARSLPDFEPRAGQAEMAAAVAGGFEPGGGPPAGAGPRTGETRAPPGPGVPHTGAAPSSA